MRSYLYAADAARWLVMLLAQETLTGIYNIGSDQGISVSDLAGCVAEAIGSPVPRLGTGGDASYYVPDTGRIRSVIETGPDLALDDSIRKTARWALNSGSVPSGHTNFQS